MDIEVLKEQLYLPSFLTYKWIEIALCDPTYLNEVFARDELKKREVIRNHYRLAHIGDYMMNAAVGDYVFYRFQTADLGFLHSVAQPLKERRVGALAYARAVGLDQPGICSLGGSINQIAERGDLFGEMFEALVGAIYVSSDRQFAVVREWFFKCCTPTMERLIAEQRIQS